MRGAQASITLDDFRAEIPLFKMDLGSSGLQLLAAYLKKSSPVWGTSSDKRPLPPSLLKGKAMQLCCSVGLGN